MARPDGGGGNSNFSMIDPDQFGAMISTLSKNADALERDAKGLQSDLDYFGIAPGDMNTVLTVAAWMHAKLPELQRRQALAEALARDVPKNADGTDQLVYLSEPVISASVATANGQANAKAMQKWLQNNGMTDEIDPTILADLADNGSDPAYTQAFFDALGPRGTQQVLTALQGSNDYQKDASGQSYGLNVLAKSFETYSTVKFASIAPSMQQAAWNSWFDSAAKDGPPGFRPDLWAALSTGTDPTGNPVTFDKNFIEALSTRVFDPNKAGEREFMRGWDQSKNPFEQDHIAQILDALGRQPQASAEWYDAHFAILNDPVIMYRAGPWSSDNARYQAVANVIHAATVEDYGNDPQLAKMNAAHLITWYVAMQNKGSQYAGLHLDPAMTKVFGDVATLYYPSTLAAITSPSGQYYGTGPNGSPNLMNNWSDSTFQSMNPSGTGFQLPLDAWITFNSEAMRDPTAAAQLSVEARLASNRYAGVISQFQGDGSQILLLNKQRSMIEEFYNATYDNAAGSLQNDITQWESSMSSARNQLLGDGVGIGEAWLGPGKTIATVFLNQPVEDLFTSAPWISGYFNPKAPTTMYDALKAVQNTQIKFSPSDVAATNSDQLQPGALDIWQGEVHTLADQAVANDLSSPVTGTPISATYGKYITDSSRDFRNAQGVPMDISQMSQAQRSAYDAWLLDPTVQSIIYSPKNLGGTTPVK